MKKLIAILLALILALGSVSFGEEEEPIKMTVWWRGALSTTMPGAVAYLTETLNNHYNVDVTIECIDKGAVYEKNTVAFASQQYPDIMCGLTPDQLAEGARNGVFVPITDYIEEHPNWNRIDKSAFASCIVDGEIYSTPATQSWPTGMFIRQDWLDNLSLEMPSTPKELADVIHAFTYDDPDGNGVDDTYGLVMDSDLVMAIPYEMMFLPTTWFSLYVDTDAGEIKNTAYLEQETKDCLQWFADIYADGSFDPEWVVTSDADAVAKFNTGIGGLYARGLMFIMNYGNKIAANCPGGQINAVPSINNNLKSTNNLCSGYALTSACKDTERGAKVLMSLWDAEGLMIFGYGREGENYEFDQNGNFKWLNEEAATMFNPGMVLGCMAGLPLYTDEPVLNHIQKDISSEFGLLDDVTLNNVTTQSELYAAKWTDSWNMASEFRTKVIVGEKTLDDWDNFIEEYKAIMDPILDELNSIYQSMN